MKPGKEYWMYELRIPWKIKTKLKKTNKHQKYNSRTLHSSKITRNNCSLKENATFGHKGGKIARSDLWWKNNRLTSNFSIATLCQKKIKYLDTQENLQYLRKNERKWEQGSLYQAKVLLGIKGTNLWLSIHKNSRIIIPWALPEESPRNKR